MSRLPESDWASDKDGLWLDVTLGPKIEGEWVLEARADVLVRLGKQCMLICIGLADSLSWKVDRPIVSVVCTEQMLPSANTVASECMTKLACASLFFDALECLIVCGAHRAPFV